MSQMLKSSGAMAVATMASRLLGLVREIVYAAFMGNTAVASAFTLAFQFPNLFRRLLGEGALTAAFIPLFKRKEIQDGEAEMWRCANAVISALVLTTGAVTLVAVAIISALLSWEVFSPTTYLMLRLLRLMLPYTVLVCLAAVLIGMANARGQFFVPALGAALLNVVMIASVWFLAPRMGATLEQQIFGLAVGVLVAGLVQAFFQLPGLHRDGFRYTYISPWKEPIVLDVMKKMVPGSIGVAAFQINVLLTYYFSFWFDKTVVATFNYAVRLMELPQGMFGISLATYLLPTLAGLAAEKKYPEFRVTLRQGLETLVFVNLIASVVSIALATPIVRLLFEHGKFGPDATERVAFALACLSPGLLMFSANNILARGFYALDDVRTPMRISVLCLIVNVGFSVWFVQVLHEGGLGLANSLTGLLNTCLLTYALKRKLSSLQFGPLRRTFLLLLPLAGLAVLIAMAAAWVWESRFGHSTVPARLGAVFLPMAAAGLVYWGGAVALKVPAAQELTQFALRTRSFSDSSRVQTRKEG
jgi:putative peptidoglycan lipid II flippase